MANVNTQSDDDEEILVYVEFEDGIDIKQARNINVLGINETSPIAQMDETHFTGSYETALGTYMFLEDDTAPKTSDPLFDKLPEKNLKYYGKTRKLIKMKHAYVTSKEDGGKEIQNDEKNGNIEVPSVTFSNIQEAINTFQSIVSKGSN